MIPSAARLLKYFFYGSVSDKILVARATKWRALTTVCTFKVVPIGGDSANDGLLPRYRLPKQVLPWHPAPSAVTPRPSSCMRLTCERP
jgi:hypothetical protein